MLLLCRKVKTPPTAPKKQGKKICILIGVFSVGWIERGWVGSSSTPLPKRGVRGRDAPTAQPGHAFPYPAPVPKKKQSPAPTGLWAGTQEAPCQPPGGADSGFLMAAVLELKKPQPTWLRLVNSRAAKRAGRDTPSTRAERAGGGPQP